MKKYLISTLSALLLATASYAADIKVLTIDMIKIYDGYYKAQDGQKKLQSAAEKAQDQLKSFVEEGQGMVDERSKLIESLENPALSDDGKKDIRTKIGDLEREIQKKQQDLQAWQKETSQSIQQRNAEFRAGMIADIKKVIKVEAEKAAATLVFDTSDVIGSGVPSVLYANPALDVTDAVLKELNKDKPNN
ncbi:MAG: OmpH family outer membrane protein [Verrucomicrobiota bacterium]|nr:OmpH family outer membrane protein [Verrucomicrobiota bacterium]